MIVKRTGFAAALVCALLFSGALPGAGQQEGGEVKFTVPQGWKPDNRAGRNVAFAIIKGKAKFTVIPLAKALTAQECKARTEQMRSSLIKSGKDPEPVVSLEIAPGVDGYMSSAMAEGGTNYFGNFFTATASYNFLLKNGDQGKFKEALSSIKLRGAAKKPAAAGKPRLTPVTYSTDKPSRNR